MAETEMDSQSTIASWAACWRCKLRHFKPLPPDSAYDSAEAAAAAGLTLTSDDIELCPLCLGLLQSDGLSKEFVEQVQHLIETEGRRVDSYILNVTTPINLLIRDAAACLRKKVSSSVDHPVDEIKFNVRQQLSEIEESKSVWKRLQRRRLTSKLGLPYFNSRSDDYENRVEGVDIFPLQIDVTITHPASDTEGAMVMDRLGSAHQQRRRKGMALHGWAKYTHSGLLTVMASAGIGPLQEVLPWPQPSAEGRLAMSVALRCGPIYLAGRYIKLSRQLCQTPWIVDGERRMESSVEELIADPIRAELDCPKTAGCDANFSSSGREDKDVRTLGMGRPFLLEIMDVRRPLLLKDRQCLQRIVERIASEGKGRIRVRDLQVVSKNSSRRLKEGEEMKQKWYRALCWCEEVITDEDIKTINAVQDLKLAQITPIRVLHRRTVMTRERTVHEMHAVKRDEHHLMLTLACQAGTYVKEFVHGDLGRTQPNLGTIVGKGFDILLLDVTKVCFDWPPLLDPVDDEKAENEPSEATNGQLAAMGKDEET